ncbi:LysR family transcriptional regulator [Thalassotalea euphylliae]|uniref:LysR family transcriptional regulator n=1 Tax=Thalassotalea euphylliae TaxID=1655234 RepID=A0A3E0UI46_9GAMM|nr:LysR family transcriptional regulator [Thalassotalea euphylliae]REL35865.1 LysR family transcriptional regulator [Thalassotalea euphylliae]
MDFKKLRTFQCAARTLNFSEAAEQLGYVQSAVTNQIKALESELNVQLFVRNGRGVALSQSGLQLFDYTQKLFSLRDEARAAVQNVPLAEPIKIGGHETVITYYLPKLLKEYSLENPNARFAIQPTPPAKLKNELLTQNLDVAFILEAPFQRQGLAVHTFQQEEIVLVCANSHPLAAKANVEVHELAKQHLLLTEKGCCYRNQFERLLISAGAYNTSAVSEFVSIETIKACVALNMGIAALSKVSAAKELAKGELIALNLPDNSMRSSVHCVFKDSVFKNKGFEDQNLSDVNDSQTALTNFIQFCQRYTFQ